jgi:hypothetical protein
MPVYDLKNAAGILEQDGKVRCAGCVKDWTTNFDHQKDEFITEGDLTSGERRYVCDYCGKQL